MNAAPALTRTILDSRLRPVLIELNNSSQHIHACAAITRDGIPISFVLDDKISADRLGAIASSLLSLSQTASTELSQGKLKQVLIEGENGYILTVEAGNNAVLSIVAEKSVNLGMIFIEARRTAQDIISLLTAAPNAAVI